jgi:hypothetical protein
MHVRVFTVLWENCTMTERDGSMTTPHFLLTMNGDLEADDTSENREIVRRIHACVSACEGLTTQELENGIVRDMRRVIGQVVPLLEEKKQLEDWLRRQLSHPSATAALQDAPESIDAA